ncbi:MAG TPA: hypothetical protein PK304_03240 [Mobilitalea sp.]|nr:hypothetical protein [Mobilitalea sp.]
MALTIIIMGFFSIVLALRVLKNKYNLLFIMMVIGMTISLFTIISEIYRSSNYLLPSSFVYRGIEYNLFLLFTGLSKISLSNLQIIRNIGIITYLTAIMLFANTFNKNVLTKNQKIKPVLQILQYTILVSYIIIYFIFYHPDTAFSIYLIDNKLKNQGNHELWESFIINLDNVMNVIAFLYMLYPIGLLIRNFFKNKISFFSEQLIGLAASLSLINTIFYFIFLPEHSEPRSMTYSNTLSGGINWRSLFPDTTPLSFRCWHL